MICTIIGKSVDEEGNTNTEVNMAVHVDTHGKSPMTAWPAGMRDIQVIFPSGMVSGLSLVADSDMYLAIGTLSEGEFILIVC